MRSALTWSSRRAALTLLLAGLTVAAGAAQRGQVLNPIQGPPRPHAALPHFRSQVDLVSGRLRPRLRPPAGAGTGPERLHDSRERPAPEAGGVQRREHSAGHSTEDRVAARRGPDVRSNEDPRERRLFLNLIDDAAVQAAAARDAERKKVARDFIETARTIGLGRGGTRSTTGTRRTSPRIAPDPGSSRQVQRRVSRHGWSGPGGDSSLYFRYSVDVVRRTVERLPGCRTGERRSCTLARVCRWISQWRRVRATGTGRRRNQRDLTAR